MYFVTVTLFPFPDELHTTIYLYYLLLCLCGLCTQFLMDTVSPPDNWFVHYPSIACVMNEITYPETEFLTH